MADPVFSFGTRFELITTNPSTTTATTTLSSGSFSVTSGHRVWAFVIAAFNGTTARTLSCSSTHTGTDTWTELTDGRALIGTYYGRISVFYSDNRSGSGTITVTRSSATIGVSIQAWPCTSDQFGTVTSLGAGEASATTLTITTGAQTDGTEVGCIQDAGGTSIAQPSGWTENFDLVDNAGWSVEREIAQKSGSMSANPQWSSLDGTIAQAMIIRNAPAVAAPSDKGWLFQRNRHNLWVPAAARRGR